MFTNSTLSTAITALNDCHRSMADYFDRTGDSVVWAAGWVSALFGQVFVRITMVNFEQIYEVGPVILGDDYRREAYTTTNRVEAESLLYAALELASQF